MDQGVRGLLLGGQASAIVIKATDLVEDARRIHGLWPVTCAALGRALMAGSMMGTALKDEEGRLTLAFKGDGPAGSLVVAAWHDGTVKGYLDQPQVDLPLRDDGKLDVGGAVGREGRVTVIRRQGYGEPYVGQTELQNGEIAEDLAYYYAASEQQPTLLALGVLIAPDGSVRSAGGAMIQPLPGCGEEALAELEGLAPCLAGIAERMEPFPDAEAAFQALFAGLDPAPLSTWQPRFQCDCSRQRMEQALVSLGEVELHSLAQEGRAELVCHFCNAAYTFDARQLWELYRSAGGKA